MLKEEQMGEKSFKEIPSYYRDKKEYVEYLRNCGFSDEEINEILKTPSLRYKTPIALVYNDRKIMTGFAKFLPNGSRVQ